MADLPADRAAIGLSQGFGRLRIQPPMGGVELGPRLACDQAQRIQVRRHPAPAPVGLGQPCQRAWLAAVAKHGIQRARVACPQRAVADRSGLARFVSHNARHVTGAVRPAQRKSARVPA